MKRNVWIFGTIAGLIITSFALYSVRQCYTNPDFQSNDVVGYAGMIAVFSLVFIGVKNYRDKYNNGIISFGQAFKTGLYITLVASGTYVAVWLVDYYIFVPDFLDKYIPHVLKEATRKGATEGSYRKKPTRWPTLKRCIKIPCLLWWSRSWKFFLWD